MTMIFCVGKTLYM